MDKKKVRCNYCSKEMFGGINHLKHHLAKIHGDATTCTKVPDDVSKLIKEKLNQKVTKNKKRKSFVASLGDFGPIQEPDEDVAIVADKGKTVGTTQMKITICLDKDARKRVCEIMARWFYHATIPFNAADSVYFPKVCESIARYGQGFKPPIPYELGTPLQNEVSILQTRLNEYKLSWKDIRCSIMSDRWMDQNGRILINFLVACPREIMFIKSVDASSIVKDANNLFKLLDEIVEEVGEEHVIQVIMDNAANYVAAGKLLMKKRIHLFWSSCAAHNLDLIFEKIGKMSPIDLIIEKCKFVAKFLYAKAQVLSMMREFTGGREILRPGATKFATNFILISSLLEQKAPLKRMFLFDEWGNSKFAKLDMGKEVEKTITDVSFWKKLEQVQKTVRPLVYVLKLVDGDAPMMAFLYDEIDKAKIEIVKDHDDIPSKYQKYWDVIDERWNSTLHSPLHAAGYFLNPKIRYRPDVSTHAEIRRGLQQAIGRLEPDMDTQLDAMNQVSDFVNAAKDFGIDTAMRGRARLSPVAWWEVFGTEHQELQRIAVRILSQNCSSSGCERNWSTFDQIYKRKRNRLQQKKLNDLVFIHYNLRMIENQKRRTTPTYDPNGLNNFLLNDEIDEWVHANGGGEFEDEDLTWLDDGVGGSTSRLESMDHGSEGHGNDDDEFDF